MVCVNAPDVYVDAVLVIVVHDVNGETELSHLSIDPVLPLNVSCALVDPEQIVVPPVTLPPAEVGLTVTVVADEFAAVQEPFCTTALN